MKNYPSASVIIPAYNAASTIKQTIEAVARQDYEGEVEIIVVDDGSTDKTPEIIQSFKNVRYLRQENAGPASARNRGARTAASQVLCFTDSDCVPLSNWIRELVAPLSDEKIAAVAGSYDIANPEFILARMIHQEIIFRHKYLMPESPKSFGSYNFCIRRNAFETLGGFNTEYCHASGEDNDLAYRLLKSGHTIHFNQNARVKHFHQTNFRKYLLEQYRHGFWRAKMYREHPLMSGGDDYTFYKDILEPAVVLACLSFGILSLFRPFLFRPFMFGMLAALSFFEVYFGLFITRKFVEGFFLGFTMVCRAFFRTFGFLVGIITFFRSKILPKS